MLRLSDVCVRQIAWLTGLALCGCILPNEPADTMGGPNEAPVLVAGSMEPSAPVSRVNVNCAFFRVTAAALDFDDASLRFRWVVRDADDTRQATEADRLTSGDPGTPRFATANIFVPIDFVDQVTQIGEPEGNRTAMLTLYVTDAPQWAIEDTTLPGQGQKTGETDFPDDFDLGAIPAPDEFGGQRFSVITHSWSFEFVETSPGDITCIQTP